MLNLAVLQALKHPEAPLVTTEVLYKNTYSSSVAHRYKAPRCVAPLYEERKRSTCQVLMITARQTKNLAEIRTICLLQSAFVSLNYTIYTGRCLHFN